MRAPCLAGLLIGLWVALAAGSSLAQNGNQGRIAGDFMREREQLAACKVFSKVVDCLQTLVTGQPLHIAVGSLAPQNGFSAGAAFVEHKDFAKGWRLSLNADAVATGNGSWRAGAYLKGYRLGGGTLQPVFLSSGPGTSAPANKPSTPFFRVAPLYTLYAETTSLRTIDYYGLGPNTLPSARAIFGLRETIAGITAIVPLGRAGLSLYGELNGRIPQLDSGTGHSGSTAGTPSVNQLYTEASTPGLTSQPAFVEPGLGVRLQPQLLAEHLRLHYFLELQDFLAVGDAHAGFRRWTADLGHEFPLDKRVHLTAANDRTGPDACTTDPSGRCPSPTRFSSTLDHEGSLSLRLLMQGSAAGAGSAVPFYLDPTLGGSDLNGQAMLPSFPDYRFRAPNLVLLRGAVEHALPRLPLGGYFSVDAGKVALNRSDIDFTNLRRSYTAGLTVHAGGLPVVSLLFSWGGGEGHHGTANVSNVLLGGSARPSLF